MSALTPIAGYPCHRVVQFSRWTNQHGVAFTDWTGACGVTDTKAGQYRVFGRAGDARRLELCTSCFPGRRRDGHFPDPVEVPSQKGTG
jgi:hypothetical protein